MFPSIASYVMRDYLDGYIDNLIKEIKAQLRRERCDNVRGLKSEQEVCDKLNRKIVKKP
eukprot:UN01339